MAAVQSRLVEEGEVSEKIDIAMYGPVRVTLAFAFTDGNQVANASYECPPGKMPSEAEIAQAAAYTLKQVRDQLGEQFWWQTRHGFVSDEFAERSGDMRFAIPGPDDWQAPWAMEDAA